MSDEPKQTPASDLEHAYDALDPRREERTPAELDAVYEPRSDSKTLESLLIALRLSTRSGGFFHALYMGPSGCGKSTDLQWLTRTAEQAEDLRDELFIVQFGIGDVVGTHKVGFAELSIALALELYSAFERLRLPPLDGSYLDRVEDWFYGSRERKDVRTRTREVGIGPRLKALKFDFSGRSVREETVVAALQNRLLDLRGLVDEMLGAVEERTGKTVLFVVDDLEKINPVDSALGLFLNQAGFFADLPCHMVLTAPGALRLDPRFQPDVLKHFREFRAVLGDPTLPDERARLTRLVHRRVDSDILGGESLDRAITETGGVVGHLISVLQEAVLLAITAKRETVGVEDVEQALSQKQENWLHSLRDGDYVELARVRQGGADSHLEVPRLLHSLAVLEYPDSPIRFAIHPLVSPLLVRWQRAALSRGSSRGV